MSQKGADARNNSRVGGAERGPLQMPDVIAGFGPTKSLRAQKRGSGKEVELSIRMFLVETHTDQPVRDRPG